MTKLRPILNVWPMPVAVLLGLAMLLSTVGEETELPPWLAWDSPEAPSLPEAPEPGPAKPERVHKVPYAPVPGRDDRTPIEYVSHVFELGDPDLPQKLNGIGPVFWKHAGRGTGAMISPTVVLTTAHLFAKDGKWKGPVGLSPKAPHPRHGRIWLDACGRFYEFASLELGSFAPREHLGLDYAIATLAQPVCEEVTVLEVSFGPDDIGVDSQDQIFIDAGYYGIAEVARYAKHPLFLERPDGMPPLALFGTKCSPTQNRATEPTAEGSTGLIVSRGCFGRPGSSGGPAVLSRDGGARYSIVGVSNSYSKRDPEYNNFTRVEGAFATHLARFVDVTEMPQLDAPAMRTAPMTDAAGPWLPTAGDAEGDPS